MTGYDPVSHRFHVHACYSPSLMCETCMNMHVLGTCICTMHVSGNQYKCHMHVSVCIMHAMHIASCAERDAVMHK